MKLSPELIGKNILIARTIKGYSQEGLAKSVNKSQNWLQKLEKGEADINLSCIKNLAEVLEVDAEAILLNDPQKFYTNNKQSRDFNHCLLHSDEFIHKLTQTIFDLLKKKT
jgi:transcriptional regulator with XRE-family HTH domain